MSKDDTIRQEVQKTLDLLDQPDRLPPNPYFFTRVQARIESANVKNRRFSNIWRPVIVSAMLLLNIGSAYWYLGGSSEIVTSHQDLVQSLAGDLNMENTEISYSLFK